LLVVLLKDSLYIDEEYYLVFKNSELRFWMVALIFLMVLIILIIDFKFKIRLIFLFVVLYYIIILNNLVSFFLLYEIIFVLIIFAIILLGYSFERLIAGFLIIFYSFLFSSPILIILLLFDHRFLIKEWLIYSNLMNYFFAGSFIVKFPIFGFHYWLPVAHVEASTIGSMVLAGILLKVGCLGLIYVVIYINFIIKFHWLAFGVIIVILIILRLRDLKLIIAYSSVAHIRMVFYVII
jgi:NADH-quinone oxidoreductase subunit M